MQAEKSLLELAERRPTMRCVVGLISTQGILTRPPPGGAVWSVNKSAKPCEPRIYVWVRSQNKFGKEGLAAIVPALSRASQLTHLNLRRAS